MNPSQTDNKEEVSNNWDENLFLSKFIDFDSENEKMDLNLLQEDEKAENIVFAKTPFMFQIQEQYTTFDDFLNIENQDYLMETMKIKKKYKCEYCD